ncbi:DUF1217 domain-containing protein [Candidatus Liberibacter brunswickensis]|uniref:DUF1217 domain-containing protein n=1 Tax=Candidatus Liberibacter brunswickensis TaxID=1968796 RepID=UPI002FDFB03D
MKTLHVPPPPLFQDNIKNKLLSNISKDPTVCNEENYYRTNIKKISTVDEFIKDKKIFYFALKAFDLLDMSHAKGFIKKILTSNISDPKSLVSKMNSLRYQKLAHYYDFSPSNKIIQSDIQQKKIIKDYINSYEHKEENVIIESKYFRQNINKINSIDQFFKNRRLLDYALQSFDINPKYIALPFLKDVLTIGLANPEKYFVKLKDNRLRAMAENFRFQPDGHKLAKDKILTNVQIESIVINYFNNTINYIPKEEIIIDQNYYKSTIGSISSFKDLLKDPKIFKMIKLSLFPLNPEIKADDLLELIKENNPKASKIKDYFQVDFNKDINPGEKIQEDNQISKIMDLYKNNTITLYNKKTESVIENYRRSLNKIKSIDDFLNAKSSLYNNSNYYKEPVTALEFALDAYNIDKKDIYKYKLRDILTSDSSDPNSYVNKLKDERFIKLNKSFNFDKKGLIGLEARIQSNLTIRDNVDNYVRIKRKAYNENRSLNLIDKKRMEKKIDLEINYYVKNIQSINSIEELLSNKRILNFLLEAKEIDSTKLDDIFLRKIFHSDLRDRTSIINTNKDNRYKEIISSFNFETHKKSSYKENGIVQDNYHINKICDLYKNQILEKKEELKDPDNALALYFKRNIPNIKNYYEILGDQKIFKVISRALKLSPYFYSLSEEKKINTLKKHVKIEDFQDPKKIDRFLYAFNYSKNENFDYKKSLLSFSKKEEDEFGNPVESYSLNLNPNKKSGERNSLLSLFDNSKHTPIIY